MAQYKSGHEKITYIKADASFDYASTQTVTANGIRGTIAMTNDGAWAALASRIITLNNSFIQSDSLINICFLEKTGTNFVLILRTVYNVAAGSCNIGLINVSTTVPDDYIFHFGYEIVN